MKSIIINDQEYQLQKNYKEVFQLEEIVSKCTDYFKDFDYIFGDYAYGKLRLKGFYDSKNKRAKEINDIANLSEYLEKYCAYNCGYFLLQKKK